MFNLDKIMNKVPNSVNFLGYVVILVLSILWSSANTLVGEQSKHIDDLNASLKLSKNAQENSSAAYLSYKAKYDGLMDKAWHNGDDLVAYIDARYTNVPVEVAEIIADSINNAIDKHEMDFSLVVGIIEVESSFNPMAKSDKGALGLMQIMPNIWGEELCVASDKEFYDIETNVLCGVKVFLHNLEKSDGDIHEALWRYNGTGGKKDEFANSVYEAVGRFEVFRAKINGEYKSVEQEDQPTVDQRLSGSKSGIE